SFLLVFKPTGGGSVKAKPLGSLIRAAAVTGNSTDEQPKTFIVTTSESLHRMYRLTFASAKPAAEFSRIAERAEAAHEASAPSKDTRGAGDASAEANARLVEDLAQKLQGRWPLVFAGSDLYGPDPNGDSQSEVLLGRGAAVLLDPAEDSKVGTYELLFYGEDEGVSEPLKRFPIGPKMALKRQDTDSEDGEGPAASFLLSAFGLPDHTISFEESSTAGMFARDFRVRQRLLEISLKTAKGQKAAQELRGELQGLRQRSPFAQVCRLLGRFLLVAFVAFMGRLYKHVSDDAVKRQPMEYAHLLGADAWQAVGMSHSAAKNIGMKACAVTLGAVRPQDVLTCGKLSKVSDMRRCIDSLTGRASVLADFTEKKVVEEEEQDSAFDLFD
ncbi:unnamed protein product, partial [Polarella glacialis]